MRTRCVNLDWLEVHCYENDVPHDPAFFREHGFVVFEREYGTRVFGQMFTLQGRDGEPFLEIRRAPKTPILRQEECRLRLVNRYCYYDDAIQVMKWFISEYNYLFVRIARVDICLDFERFDSNDDPERFMRRYMEGRYSKINQSNINAHGSDEWHARVWNSVSWGSPTSDIGTKFYNKTMELYEPSKNTWKKPWIRQSWGVCGLVDDWYNMKSIGTDGKPYTPQIWRVEFSIRSSVKKWFAIEIDGKSKNYQSIPNTLDCYDTREKLLLMFASLANHYFHFKHYHEETRKDRCPDKVLFDFQVPQVTYKIDKDKLATARKPSRLLSTLANRLRDYRETHQGRDLVDACNTLIKAIEDESLRVEMNEPFTREELEALRRTLSIKMKNPSLDAAVLLREVREWLHITDRIEHF